MSQPKASKVYALAMFFAVSVLCGLLTAGLIVPWVAMAGGAAKAGADSMDELPTALDIPPQAEISRILMADGSELGQFYDQNRVYVPLSKISPIMKVAQVAIEDHRFYEHGAFDPTGTLRALIRNSAGGATQGGSTLTQQYVKQVLVQQAAQNEDAEGIEAAQEQTVSRKVRELRYAIALEKKYSKDEILERYLNIAYYGDGAYGIEAASKHFLGKSAAYLDLGQAALLAGLVQNPTATNPRIHTDVAVQRRNVVLNRMVELGLADEAEVKAIKAKPFKLPKIAPEPNGCIASPFPHICDYVRRTLLSDAMPSLGKTPQERESMLKRGGLTIQTLIDPRTQRATEEAIADRIKSTDPVIASSVILQPSTGLIVAMAQSRPKMGSKPGETFLNYSVERSMGDSMGFQAGSTFKAFTIAAALEAGLTPSKKYTAYGLKDFQGETFKNCQGSFVFPTEYKVKNSVAGYDDRVIDMVEAAQGSVNTYFVQLEQTVGICEVTKMAGKVGAKLASGKPMTSEANNPSFTLGSADVTPLSMAEAYATFANRGVHCKPLILKSVTNKQKKNFAIPSANCTKVMEPQIADGVNYVLGKVMEGRGTGRRVAMPGGWPQAGKTGTTDKNEAVWFAGYTPEMAGITMIALDKADKYWQTHRKSLYNMVLPSGQFLEGSGSGDSGPIWRVAMAEALKGKPKTPFVKPTEEVLEGKKIQVPDVTDMSYSEARKVLEAAGFTTVTWRVYHDSPEGTFLGITPEGRQPMGSVIYMRISAGRRPPPPKPKPTQTPTASPTAQPSTQPTTQPTTKPTTEPTTQPSKPGKKP